MLLKVVSKPMIDAEDINIALQTAKPLFNELQNQYENLAPTQCRCQKPGVCCAYLPQMTLMEALQSRVRLMRDWEIFLQQYPVLLCPVSAEAPFPDQLDVESVESFQRVLEAQMTQIGLPLMGMPAISVATSGAAPNPMGVQLVAARFREDILFNAASDIAARNPPLEVADLD